MEKEDWLEEVEALSQLSKLAFSVEEREEFIKEFQKITAFAAKIKELDLEEVEPLIYPNIDEENKTRADRVEVRLSRDQALKNAPRKDSDYFRVPKIFET